MGRMEAPERITEIALILPKGNDIAEAFFMHVIKLLQELPNSTQEENKLTFTVLSEANEYLPRMVIAKENVLFPQINFVGAPELSLKVGNFYLNPSGDEKIKLLQYDSVEQAHDSHGEYWMVSVGDLQLGRLSTEQLYRRLTGHIVRLDHIGINLPATMVDHETWRQFIYKVAAQTAMYNYPTGEEWPFILPASKSEFEGDITTFFVGREPRFEFVYDTYTPIPEIQIDIETNLARGEVEELFPAPYGIAYGEMSQYFRTVYLYHAWRGLNIRFDIRYKSNKPSEWETGEWLVEQGGRISSSDL